MLWARVLYIVEHGPEVLEDLGVQALGSAAHARDRGAVVGGALLPRRGRGRGGAVQRRDRDVLEKVKVMLESEHKICESSRLTSIGHLSDMTHLSFTN